MRRGSRTRSVREGVLQGIEDGYIHREIREASSEYQQRVEAGDGVGGVNGYTIEEDTSVDVLKVDDDVRERQLDRLAAVKAERDDDAVAEALATVDEAIATGENVMPGFVDAVRACATMGEIMGGFQDHHGAYREKIGLA